ncbi:MAG: A/G-specific adenine glycosylase [Acidimicrobiales bacterium]
MVSELMLQQTQVARVIDRLARFIERFPTPAACADASPGDVIDEWQGLGYNRRALNLHRAATVITEQHDGVVPADLAALLHLPGIGPYTARAIRVFAYECDDGVLDTNIGRVLARVSGRTLRPAEVQRLADDLVPTGEGWAWNQALMEVGALCCRPRPRCEACPLRHECSWFAADLAAPDPASASASVSKRQSAFDGSDRQGRGRLVDALRVGPVQRRDLARIMGWPDQPERATAVAGTVVADGLAVVVGDQFRLP